MWTNSGQEILVGYSDALDVVIMSVAGLRVAMTEDQLNNLIRCLEDASTEYARFY